MHISQHKANQLIHAQIFMAHQFTVKHFFAIHQTLSQVKSYVIHKKKARLAMIKAPYVKHVFEGESIAMKLAGHLGLSKLRWSLRRLHCPVSKSALVLEVGAGGNPYPRANVLLDAMESTIERNEQCLVSDRPLILGLCEELPFKDKSFDFVIASHVLEHTDNPEKFLSELMRVGKAGYIETPEAWFEKMCAFTYHRLEVSVNKNKLFIRKKKSWKPEEIARLWDERLAKSKNMANFLRINPDLNHLRFYWSEFINFEVINPETDANWPYPEETKTNIGTVRSSIFMKARDIYLSARRWLFSQNFRNQSLDIYKLIRCPSCHSTELTHSIREVICTDCLIHYPIKNKIPNLFPRDINGFNKVRLCD